MKPSKNSVRGKTIHYILVYFICLLVAVAVWLAVTYDVKKEGALDSDKSVAAVLDSTCSI